MTGYNPQIERLAKVIAGENPGQVSFGYAYQMAAALLDQRRIREARLKLLQDPAERVKEPPLGKVNWAINRMCAFAEGKASGDDKAKADGPLADFEGYKYGGGEHALEKNLAVLAPKLERLDRYERRACTRFRKALRLFDVHLPELANPTEPPADQ